MNTNKLVSVAKTEIRVFQRVGLRTSENLVAEIERLQEKIEAAKNCLVCAAIADPLEVAEVTLAILSADDDVDEEDKK
jgi:hypothetical protein